jgi:hypothetical protein
MSFIVSLRRTNRGHWRDASTWLAFTLVGNLAPVWFGLFSLRVLSRHVSLADFSHHGEFALYSATLFASAAYVILKDFKVMTFPARPILGLLCFSGMFVAAAFFAPVTTAFISPKPVFDVDQEFLWQGTFVLFLVSCTIGFLVTILDNARIAPDLVKTAKDQQDQLASDFDKLGGGK